MVDVSNGTRRVSYCLLPPSPSDNCAVAYSATNANRGVTVFSWLRSTLPHYAVPCSDVSRHRKRLQRGYRHYNYRGLSRGQSQDCCSWSRCRRFSGGSLCRTARRRFLMGEEKNKAKYEGLPVQKPVTAPERQMIFAAPQLHSSKNPIHEANNPQIEIPSELPVPEGK